MIVRNVNELRAYLKQNALSPERFAEQASISHMTVRRWLKREGRFEIPEKYHLLFDRATGVSDASAGAESSTFSLDSIGPGFAEVTERLERDGSAQTDLNDLKRNLDGKLEDQRIDQKIRMQVTELWNGLRSNEVNLRTRAICVGALLYLINPVDFIPDTVAGFGYLDDMAVLSLAMAALKQQLVPRKLTTASEKNA